MTLVWLPNFVGVNDHFISLELSKVIHLPLWPCLNFYCWGLMSATASLPFWPLWLLYQVAKAKFPWNHFLIAEHGRWNVEYVRSIRVSSRNFWSTINLALSIPCPSFRTYLHVLHILMICFRGKHIDCRERWHCNSWCLISLKLLLFISLDTMCSVLVLKQVLGGCEVRC
jgi:hypothetical protein